MTRVRPPACLFRIPVAVLLCLAVLKGGALAQAPELFGRPVVEVRLEQEGQPLADRLLAGLIETEVGAPLSMRDVRSSIDHLYGLNRFDDIRVSAEPAGDGVRLTFVLLPRHAVQSVEFEGTLGLSEDELRQVMAERFGALPSATRAQDVANALAQTYRERGFLRARVQPRLQEFHDPDRAVLTFVIDAGMRAPIERVDVEGLEGPDRLGVLSESEARPGRPYDSVALQRRLARYESDQRTRGFYEARATQRAEFTPEGGAIVTIDVDRGPHVSIAFSGDPLPSDARDDLVPLGREGSVDEDLLEDASRAIEDYLLERGYRDAVVSFTRDQKGEELVITFAVSRGLRHLLEDVRVVGNRAFPTADLIKVLQVETGRPFVEAAIARGARAVTQAYRGRGFTRARIEPVVSLLPRTGGASAAGDREVIVTLNVNEGPRTVIGAIELLGNTVLNEGQIRSVMTTAPGRPFSEVEVAQDRDRVQLQYLDLGYESAVISTHVTLAENDTRADLRVSISEGPQILVDHIIIVGNRRTSTNTIQRALLLEPGLPLGYTARVESQQRLAALGLFRRFRITDIRHGSEPRRDVLVEVEEAPPTTLDYGGGVEGGSRLRVGPSGQAEERFELAPRGFFQIGRRNLFGKNRSINLFTRVALKTRDTTGEDAATQSNYGFNEYRVVAAYREPRVFDTTADAVITATLDQAIRSGFNFRSRELRAETGVRLKEHYGVSGRYSFEHNELFDISFDESERPLIDRLFPQVRLSKLSLSIFRDTRNDVLDPDRGTFLSADNDVALRALGSEVGFVRTFLQASTFRRLPPARRMVVRLRGIVGMAQGFEQIVDLDVVQDLPASERFFAGGDTSVRGFSLDRLGTPETITESGFPRGGNGLIIVNSELLVNVWRALDAVGFVDSGNVFLRVGDLDVTDLRPAAGFGLRYRSPVGPVRIDLGFNLDPRVLVPGTLERRSHLHVSLGQAF
jgi:outer membrane protein insertion porin family